MKTKFWSVIMIIMILGCMTVKAYATESIDMKAHLLSFQREYPNSTSFDYKDENNSAIITWYPAIGESSILQSMILTLYDHQNSSAEALEEAADATSDIFLSAIMPALELGIENPEINIVDSTELIANGLSYYPLEPALWLRGSIDGNTYEIIPFCFLNKQDEIIDEKLYFAMLTEYDSYTQCWICQESDYVNYVYQFIDWTRIEKQNSYKFFDIYLKQKGEWEPQEYESKVYYFPCGGMSSGAMIDLASSYEYYLDMPVDYVGVRDGGAYGLVFSDEAIDRIKTVFPYAYQPDGNMLALQNSPESFEMWTMSELMISSLISLDQPNISPLYHYRIAIDQFIPSEMSRGLVITSDSFVWGEGYSSGITGFGITPSEEAFLVGSQEFIFSFPAQDDIYVCYVAEDLNSGEPLLAYTHIDVSGLGLGDRVSVDGILPREEFTPYTIHVEKEGVIREN